MDRSSTHASHATSPESAVENKSLQLHGGRLWASPNISAHHIDKNAMRLRENGGQGTHAMLRRFYIDHK
eukprot:12415874-Karenia_brevis.AAC.1